LSWQSTGAGTPWRRLEQAALPGVEECVTAYAAQIVYLRPVDVKRGQGAGTGAGLPVIEHG